MAAGMSHSSAEILTGAAVLIVAAGFAFYAAEGAGFSSGKKTYPLTASFRSVQGISSGADVRLAGVKIGTITDLKLNPETFFADTRIAVYDDVRLPSDSAILISQDGLLGGAFVEVIPGGMPDDMKPGDEIMDTQGAVNLISLMMKFVTGSESGTENPK